MANLSMTIGSWRQFQLTVTKNGAVVDLTGIQSLTFTALTPWGSQVVSWGLGTGVTVSVPSTSGIAILTVSPAMLAGIAPILNAPYNWALVDSLGFPTLDLDTGTMTFMAP